MLTKFVKSEELIGDLAQQIKLYEDEMQDTGYVEIEEYSGPHSKKGFAYDLIIRVFEDDDSEVESFHYFSAYSDDQEQADHLVNEVKELLNSKEVKFEKTYK